MKLKVDKIIILISHEESMEEISDMILDLDKIKNNFQYIENYKANIQLI